MTREVIRSIPDGTYTATDEMDDDGMGSGAVRLRVRITIDGSNAHVDFTGSDPQVRGSINAVYAITASVVFYVFRTLVDVPIPSTAGGMRPLRIVAPEGSVVNARPPAAVCAGNVETSQRIVDLLYRCLAVALPDRIPAASQGTMNNVTFGGTDPRTGQRFAYYETVAGGMGARPGMDGLSGVHTHMTNSMNTPVEALEYAYPVRVEQYSLRKRSGGAGQWRGGDGIVREIRFLAPVELTVLAERRKTFPYGLRGGLSGRRGRTSLRHPDGTVEIIPGKVTMEARAGDALRLETPGGGGWGSPRARKNRE
jgi:N-methylhydantoinase B